MSPVSTAARQPNVPTTKFNTLNSMTSSHFEDGEGKQELCPGSGVYIPTIKLRQCHHKAGAEMKVLFHVLMDHFFTEEILAKSVAFNGIRTTIPRHKRFNSCNLIFSSKVLELQIVKA